MVDADGLVRVVLSARDPGVANWLDTAGHSNGAMILRCVRTETAPIPERALVEFDDIASALPADTTSHPERTRGSSSARRRAVHERFADDASPRTNSKTAPARRRASTTSARPTTARASSARSTALNNEADLNDMGSVIQHATISNALIQRLKIEDTYEQHPEIDDEVVDGPVFVIGLPRTGTTALSQLVANDPQFRSLRMWESQAPTPPPEAATQHTDPRIAQAAAGLAMIDEMFPLMKTMIQTRSRGSDRMPGPDGDELSDLPLRRCRSGPRVPGVADGDCDMRETYTYHRRVLKLLQWHCPPTLWHLKHTGAHVRARCTSSRRTRTPSSCGATAIRRRSWRSVCSLIRYVRSWSSDRDDPEELGAEQLRGWAKGIAAGHGFPQAVGDDRFVDVSFADLQTDPVKTVATGYDELGLDFTDAARAQGRSSGPTSTNPAHAARTPTTSPTTA